MICIYDMYHAKGVCINQTLYRTMFCCATATLL